MILVHVHTNKLDAVESTYIELSSDWFNEIILHNIMNV